MLARSVDEIICCGTGIKDTVGSEGNHSKVKSLYACVSFAARGQYVHDWLKCVVSCICNSHVTVVNV